jgi:nucleoside-diphosphate-sugar epimerase
LAGNQIEIIGDAQRLRPQNSEVFRLLGCNKKLKEHTGWAPDTSLEQGLKQTIEWFSIPENLAGYKHEIYNM